MNRFLADLCGMKLSNTLTQINGDGDDGWGLFNEARRRMAAGAPIQELTIGEHDIRTHQSILDAMHISASNGHTGYAEIPGIQPLREAVARRMEDRTGVRTTPDNVLITPGGQSALFAAHRAALDSGDTGLYLDPHYTTYPGTIRAIGAIAKPIFCHSINEFQPQATDIRAASNGARSLLINSPNNPTGVVYTEDTINGIADAVRDADLWLISDEVYDTQIWEGSHISPRALPGMVDRTLVVGSMSKSHAMTGSRVGWIVGPEIVIEHLINLSTNTTYGVPGYIQDAALFALDQGSALEQEVAAPFERRRRTAKTLIKRQNTVALVPSGGAMYLMLDIRQTGLSGIAFAQSLLDVEEIAVMPGESFGSSAAGHVRVAMTLEDKAFEQALTRVLAHAGRLSG